MTQATASLDVSCSICDARPGRSCEDVVGGFMCESDTPHLYRVRVAEEVAR